ncbi:MAG TPA: endolytic transglycosylase MltG, partial [Acidocella sp.]|nr:endolytic transglycosylase MltG [Acidocella sp.]
MRRSGRILLLLMAVLVTLRVGQEAVRQAYTAPGIAQSATDVFVTAGGSHGAAEELAKAGVVQYPLVFRAASYFTRGQGPLRTGEYMVPARASIAEILQLLRHGPQVEHQVTIPEGLTGAEIAAILNAAPLAMGQVAAPAEGSVLPQTYNYLWNTPRDAILRRAQNAMQAGLDVAWPKRDADVPLNSGQDAIILASIVQAEAKLPAEMPHIAGVYENRLRQGMKLQADPTVIYAVTDGAKVGGVALHEADMGNPSPYNT